MARDEPAKVRRRWRDLIEYHDRSVVPDAPLSVLRRQDLWNGPDRVSGRLVRFCTLRP